MDTFWMKCIMLSMSMGMVWSNHKHCNGVTPLPKPSQPFAGRWYVYATTPCYDSASTKYRYGLFNNKVCKCEVIDFYSNGRSYEVNKPTHFIDYAYNENTKDSDITVFDYYTLNSTYSESNLGVYVAESKGYYDDKKMHPGSSGSSSSSEENKKSLADGKHRFFFTCLANQPDYKVFYVCTKFHHLSHGQPVVWVLTSSATPSPGTIESVKTCLKSNNVNVYDSLTVVNHSSCNYKKAQDSYGGYSYSR
ncbi:hypothetical protein WDU94_014633 [Cyamophila willieti]